MAEGGKNRARVPDKSAEGSAARDRLHDIEPIARAKGVRRMLRPGHESAIKPHGKRRTRAVSNERIGNRRAFGQRQRLLVEMNIHDVRKWFVRFVRFVQSVRGADVQSA